LFDVVGYQGWVREFQASHVAFPGCALIAMYCDDVALWRWEVHGQVEGGYDGPQGINAWASKVYVAGCVGINN